MDVKATDYLERFLVTLPEEGRRQSRQFDAYHFCADQKNADTCAELVLNGDKRATAGLVWSYEAEAEPLPEVGKLTVITDWSKTPRCIIETTAVEIRPFKDVDSAFAFEEGEGDKTLESWRKEHWKFFSAECHELGIEPSQEMPVVLERFQVVYREQ
ncbi:MULTISPECIES: ASCH domain-containing protein [Thiorhodovibrio]|uniref:ASCH domain-containing protein n=1 Tax=Thiorhodovibrio TaxID=61593 RepID=UPI001912E89A|nr:MULTISPECIES: ASCH domain-containing protein [Thiorhodovibrio]MBK5970976.1 RNA-binding protein [Thiorhodovibrio winogradskyi]WPL10657.1 ASCH domain protein [Thiorhodovibrio litoralis]